MACPCCPGSSDIKKIRIGNQEIGIVGFDMIVNSALNMENASDDDIREVLLNLAKVHNYIPKSVEKEYLDAIWNEFLKIRAKRKK